MSAPLPTFLLCNKHTEERDVLCNKITRRLKAVLTWKKLSIDEVNTEYGWDPVRVKRLMQGMIRYKIEDAVILANTFELPVEFFTGDYGEEEVEKISLMIMFSELSEEHQKDILEMMQSDDIEKASKELIAKLEEEK